MKSVRSLAAHCVTGIRVFAAPIVAGCVVDGWFGLAATMYVLAAISDFGDGWVARRLNVASNVGRWFDHLADIVFLLAGFGALVARGVVPLMVPVSIFAAFSFYVVDSMRQSATRSLIGSRIGHLSGILNYGILGVLLFDGALGGAVVPGWLLTFAFAAVPLYSAAAIAGRLASGRIAWVR